MTNQDYFYGSRTIIALLPITLSSATVTNGLPISLEKGISYKLSLVVYSRTNGTAQIQDLQVADDNAFTTNVRVFSASSYPEQVLGNDRASTVDAFTQTLLSADGIKSIHFRSLGVNKQAFIRPRIVTVGGTVALSAFVVVEKLETEAPINPVQS
jgi:hypothetical protein